MQFLYGFIAGVITTVVGIVVWALRQMEQEFPPHKCSVWDYCVLDNEYKLFFCVFCHKVVGFEKDGKRMIKPQVLDKEHTIYGQKEYSDDILRDSV